jgi:hypothetical protein
VSRRPTEGVVGDLVPTQVHREDEALLNFLKATTVFEASYFSALWLWPVPCVWSSLKAMNSSGARFLLATDPHLPTATQVTRTLACWTRNGLSFLEVLDTHETKEQLTPFASVA